MTILGIIVITFIIYCIVAVIYCQMPHKKVVKSLDSMGTSPDDMYEVWVHNGKTLGLTDLQKNQLWINRYQNKAIKWEGKIEDITEQPQGMINIKCRIPFSYIDNGDKRHGEFSIYLTLNASERERLLTFNKRQIVTIEGMLPQDRWEKILSWRLEHPIIT